MADDPGNLIDTATRKLPNDPELKLLAGKELQHLLDEQEHAPNGGTSPERDRWYKADANYHGMIGRWLLISLILLISTFTFVSWQREIAFYTLQWFSSDHWLNGETLQAYRERMLQDTKAKPWTPAQELLLFGDVSRDSLSEAKKALWDSEPSDPSYYMEYVKAHLEEKKSLPPDYLPTISNLDPENAALVYVASGIQAKEASKKIPQSAADRKARKPVEWEITDETKVGAALTLAEAAGSKPHFDFREGQIAAKRAAILLQGNQVQSHEAMNLIYSSSFLSFSLRPLAEAYQAKARWCALNARPEEFRALLGSMERFYQLQISGEHPLLIELLLLESMARDTYACFERSAAALGLTGEAERLRSIHERLQQRLDHRRSTSPPSRTKTERELLYPPRFLLDPVEIDDRLLHPGILRDHAFTSRLFVICLAGLVGFASLLFFLTRFMSSPLVRGLSSRFSQLYGVLDRLWILSIGMLLPAGFTLAVSRFTLFGLEYWGVDDSLPILPIAHLIATFLLAIGMSIIAARWRLATRAPSFGFAKGIRWYEWVAVISAVLYIPLIGWRMQTHEPTPKELCLWAIPLVPILAWIATFVTRTSLGDFRDCLASAAVARVLIPICGWTVVSLLLFSHLLKIEEDRWHGKYTWNSFTPESRGATQAEAFLAKHVLLELRQALDFQP